MNVKSKERPPSSRLLQALAAMLALLSCPLATAQAGPGTEAASAPVTAPATPLKPPPQGKLGSVEQARQVLSETALERSRIEQRYSQEQSACAIKFLVNACMGEARERRRQALAQLRPAEIEAGLYIRRTRAIEREKILSDKQALEEEKRKQAQIAEQQSQASDAAGEEAPQAADNAAAGASRAADSKQRIAQHEARRQRQARDDAAMAQKQAGNIADHQKKVRDSEARQKEIAAKKAEKESAEKAKAGNAPK